MNDLLQIPLEDLRAAASDLLRLSGDTRRVQSVVQQQGGRLDRGWQSYARTGKCGRALTRPRESD